MTKEEKIQEAWSFLWGNFNNTAKECAIKNNGYISAVLENNLKQEFTYLDEEKKAWRPKSLQGIEDNNGWIKIESEDDLPKHINNLWLLANDGSTVLGQWCIFEKIFKTTYGNNFDSDGIVFTHYQPIEKPKPPVY